MLTNSLKKKIIVDGELQAVSHKHAVSCFPHVCLWLRASESLFQCPIDVFLCHKAEHSHGQWILFSSVFDGAW